MHRDGRSALLALNRCSVFKVQKVLGIENEIGEVQCLGVSGYSAQFSRVTRITAKFQNVPGSNKDPLARWGLAGEDLPLN